MPREDVTAVLSPDTVIDKSIVGRKPASGTPAGLANALTPLEAQSVLEEALLELELTDGATITYDLSLGRNAKVLITATGRTFNFTNPVEGVRGTLRVIQDGGGAKTITTWQVTATTGWVLHEGGVAPALSAGGGAIDLLNFYYTDGRMHLWVASLDSSAV